jgi:hypothetical protein
MLSEKCRSQLRKQYGIKPQINFYSSCRGYNYAE